MNKRAVVLLAIIVIILTSCGQTVQDAPEGGPSNTHKITKDDSYPRVFRIVDEQYGNVCYVAGSGSLFCLHIEGWRGE